MALPVIISRNQTQRITSFPKIARLTSTATVWYTCPTGKKATFSGYVIPDAFGAGTEIKVQIAGNQASPALSVVAVQSDNMQGVVLAGETIGYSQDSGSNASVDGVWTITETPA